MGNRSLNPGASSDLISPTISVASPPVWTESFSVRSYDVDLNRRASLPALCRYFLEAAWNHAEVLGVGFSRLADQKLFWVLSRLLICVDTLPEWGQPLTLHTWPRPTRSLFAMRDFEFLDLDGRQIVAGSSAWLVLDAVRRRPQKLDKLLSDIHVFPERTATGRDPEKLPAFTPSESAPAFPVRYSDIDVNSHVNSATYLAWILDSYPSQFHQSHSLKTVEINYLEETRAGETVVVNSLDPSEAQSFHSIERSGGGTACRARLTWRQ